MLTELMGPACPLPASSRGTAVNLPPEARRNMTNVISGTNTCDYEHTGERLADALKEDNFYGKEAQKDYLFKYTKLKIIE